MSKARRNSNDTVNNKQDKYTPVRVFARISAYSFPVVGSLTGATTIPFDDAANSEDDFGAMQGGIFFCPAGKGGNYIISCRLAINDNSVGFGSFVDCRIRVNDEPIASASMKGMLFGWGAGDQYPTGGFSIPLKLNPGDKVEIIALQAAGSARSLLADSRTHFTAMQVSQDEV